MKRVVAVPLVFAVLLCGVGATQAQVASHYLPPEWPRKLLPPYVSGQPKVDSEQLSAPLFHEMKAARAIKVDRDEIEEILSTGSEGPQKQGKPDATTLADMCTAPKQVVEQALRGEHREAVQAGRKLLGRPKDVYGDFTWDYLASAVGWSLIQLGDLEGAAAAHRSGVAQIDDKDLCQYHIRVARLITSVLNPEGEASDASARLTIDELRKPGTIGNQLRRGLRPEVVQVKRSLELTRKAKTAASRLSNLEVAYENLRVIMAIDPVVAGRLLGDFKSAANTLVSDTAEKMLQKAREQYDVLRLEERKSMRKSTIKAWNREVRKLWDLIAEVKRLCRIHNYLERLNLAGAAFADVPFKAAHELLYAPGEGREVYKLAGGRNSLGGTDMRRRGKSLDEPEDDVDEEDDDW